MFSALVLTLHLPYTVAFENVNTGERIEMITYLPERKSHFFNPEVAEFIRLFLEWYPQFGIYTFTIERYYPDNSTED